MRMGAAGSLAASLCQGSPLVRGPPQQTERDRQLEGINGLLPDGNPVVMVLQ